MAAEVCLGGVRLVVPTSAVVELHPVVLAVLNFTGILQSLGQNVTKIIVVRSILEAEIAYITQIFVEFFKRS